MIISSLLREAHCSKRLSKEAHCSKRISENLSSLLNLRSIICKTRRFLMDTAFLLPLASSIHRPVQSTIGHLRLSRAKGVMTCITWQQSDLAASFRPGPPGCCLPDSDH